MTNLWSANTPQLLWRCLDHITEGEWQDAVRHALPSLGLPVQYEEIDTLLGDVLGEGQFGPNHWRLSATKRLYYFLKPILPRSIVRSMRRTNRHKAVSSFPLSWPIEDRYVNFQWQIIRNLVESNREIKFIFFWPQGFRFAFVLTHDIETAKGQELVRRVAEFEKNLGFISSFNFILEKYPLDYGLIEDLRENGFEVGIHGLKHDGRLFSSHKEFTRRVKLINGYLKQFNAIGFRSPMTLRQPEWMQALDVEYDLSFFDTDPFEPIPGGVMSIWPFEIGRFIELPYTLAQDSTLTAILHQETPQIWLEKVDYLKEHHGMALVNVHPDYLADSFCWKIYTDFLYEIKKRGYYWNALPKDVSSWWRKRSNADSTAALPGSVVATIRLDNNEICIETG